MKKKSLIMILVSIALTNVVFAHGGEDHSKKEKKNEHHSMAKKKLDLVRGQLIGLTCFVKHSSKGAAHKDCFKECAEKGLPIGILTAENEIYQISGEGHKSLSETNKKFMKYAEEKVIVKGQVFNKNGIKMIVVEKIKKI